MLLAAATEPARGWGGPAALLAAFLIFRVVVMPAGRWVMSKIGNSSPTPALPPAERVKAQATVGVTDDGSGSDAGWWGRIVEVGGVRVRQAQQVWRTGSHELPPADDGEDDDLDEDPEIDLALDEDEPDDEDEGETVEQYIARARDLKLPYAQIVRVVMEYYDLTEPAAKYRIRKVDAENARK
jgi:hypothetical protein